MGFTARPHRQGHLEREREEDRAFRPQAISKEVQAVSGRRSSFINYKCCISSDIVQVTNRYNNANIIGATSGWLKWVYNSTANTMQALFYNLQNGSATAQSTADVVTGNAQVLTLAQIGESGISGTVTFNGVSISLPGLALTSFSVDQIGRTAIQVSYQVNKAVKCTFYFREDTGPGEWQTDTDYASAFHSTHPNHQITGLTQGTWYHIYVSVEDEDANTLCFPCFPPNYYRIKTATLTAAGIEDGIIED